MTTKRPTLLVVDDEPEVLRSIHDLFRLDHRVLTCERGDEAIKILESLEDIQVVMSDQRMPGISGVDVLRRAHRVRPEATRLLLTAYSDIRAVIDAINQGSVFRYISKPWDPEELQSVVRQAVEQHDLIVEKSLLLTELQETNRRLVEANRLKGAFIEVASHELNTPVAVVLGMTQLWKMTQAEQSTPAEQNWVERIHNAGKRLAATVERMLKLVRSDELSRPLDLQTVDLATLVCGVVTDLQPFLDARRQRLDLAIEPELGFARLDAAKISDALANLLINAIKFTPDDGVIRLSASSVGPDRVRFEVADQGVGIDPATRPYMFEPFFTGFDTMHHSSGEYEFCKRGIGLGLCLVKRFVELHGGEIEVCSTPGVGSTFVISLPRDLDTTPALGGGERAEPVNHASGRR
jgi:signal transduction histidine kinase